MRFLFPSEFFVFIPFFPILSSSCTWSTLPSMSRCPSCSVLIVPLPYCLNSCLVSSFLPLVLLSHFHGQVHVLVLIFNTTPAFELFWSKYGIVFCGKTRTWVHFHSTPPLAKLLLCIIHVENTFFFFFCNRN